MDWDNTYWSAGKLLLTSEYVVIDGAEALAIPSKFGQDLKVKSTNTGIIHWIGKTNTGDTWLDCELDSNTLKVSSSNDPEKAQKLSTYLCAAKKLSSIFPSEGALVETNLDFPRDWGLGSSSTLLTNISKWLGIDAFELHFAVSNGSGYDIACGLAKEPLIYEVQDKRPTAKQVNFNPPFSDNIFFIHLNQKQFSDKEVARYSELKEGINLSEICSTFSELTKRFTVSKDLEEFESLIVEHENLMAHVLQRDTIRETLFQLYSGGAIKSLGAWGGDFVMVTAKSRSDLDYFRHKGYCTIINYKDMIK